MCAEISIPISVRQALTPPEDLSVSQWCDRNRQLDRRWSFQPGTWRTAETPYLREPLDALTDPEVSTLTFIKPSRIGGSEWLNNILGYSADARPMPAMYVQPTREMVEEELGGRIRSMFESDRHLRKHIPEGEWATAHRLTLDTMTIYGAWATAEQTLIRRTIGLLVFDEIDNIVRANGRLGDILDVAAERVVTAGHRGRVIVTGTPTTEDAAGWRALQRSDHRRPWVPCPNCGTYQVISMEQVVLAEGHESCRDPDEVVAGQLARLRCPGCHRLLEHREAQRWMIDRTAWVPRALTPDEPLPLDRDGVADRALACLDPGVERWAPRLAGEPRPTRHRGYWINSLYSPWASRTWSDALAQFFRVSGRPEQLRVFRNSWEALPWVDAVETSDAKVIGQKRGSTHRVAGYNPEASGRSGGSYPARTVPAEGLILLMGADVQGENRPDQVYWVIRAFGLWERSWLVAEGASGTLDQAYRIAFHTGFPRLDGLGLQRCHALFVDSRHRQPEVYEFARRPGVYAVKGEMTLSVPTKAFPMYRSANGSPMPGSPLVQHVNTAYFKDKLARLQRMAPGDPGYWGIHESASDAYLQHITNEHKVRTRIVSKRHGDRVEYRWRPRREGARVDWWDCEVYALAGAELVGVPFLRAGAEPVGLMRQVEPVEAARLEHDGHGGIGPGYIA